jgi:hypothetical protein
MLDFDPLADTIERLPPPLASGGVEPPVPKLPFEDEIRAASIATGIPESLLRAKIQRESNFNPNAIGGVGEIGLAQVRPTTAANPGYGVTPMNPDDLRDPAKNAMFGAQYLAARGKAAGVKDWSDPAQAALGLTAYNGGGPNYAASVMKNMPGPMTAPAAPAAPEQPNMTGRTLGAYRAERENPNNWVSLTNQGAVRNLPITDTLRSSISSSVEQVFGPGFQAKVYSGGQPRPGEGRRVGSTRHDGGNAADVYIYDPDGKRVTGDGLAPLAKHWLSNSLGGVGLEMRGGGIHLDTHTDRSPFWFYGQSTPAQRAAVQEAMAARQGGTQAAAAPQPAAPLSYAPAMEARPDSLAPAFSRSLGRDVVPLSPMAGGVLASIERPGANAMPEPGTQVASATGLPANERASAAPPRIAQAPTSAQPSGGSPMASPIMSAQGGPPSAPGAASDAPSGPGWAQNIDWDGLMMSLALIDNAIPRGVQARGIGEVVSPFMQAQARKEDRRYQMNRDRKNDERQYMQDGRQASQDAWQRETADRNYQLQVEAQKRADAAAERAAAAAGMNDTIKTYNFDMKQREEGGQPRVPFNDWNNARLSASRAQTNVNVGGGSDKQVFDEVAPQAKEAQGAVRGLAAIRDARQAVVNGGIFGAGADARLGFQKLAASLGLADADKVVETETFRSAIAPQVSAMLKSTVGSAQISNADREFAEKAAGGSISLDEKSILRLLDIMERANVATVQSHIDRLDRVYPEGETNPAGKPAFSRERALFGVQMPRFLEQGPTVGESLQSPADAAKRADALSRFSTSPAASVPDSGPAPAQPAPKSQSGNERRVINGVTYERAGKNWFRVQE